jgi:transcriptional regulator with XRE-family HTH domain
MLGATLRPFKITDPVAYDLGRLTASEELVLWRFRQRSTNGRLFGRVGAGMSQAEAAAALGISRATYTRLEDGGSPRLSAQAAKTLLTALGPLRPTTGELCFIARRRSGLYLSEVESRVGVSRPRYHELERAGEETIVAFWEDRGFKFP